MTKIYLVVGINFDYTVYDNAYRTKKIAVIRSDALDLNESNEFLYYVEEIELIE